MFLNHKRKSFLINPVGENSSLNLNRHRMRKTKTFLSAVDMLRMEAINNQAAFFFQAIEYQMQYE